MVQARAAEAQRQELHHGMFALRSFLLPNAYVMVTWALQGVGLTFNPFVVRFGVEGGRGGSKVEGRERERERETDR